MIFFVNTEKKFRLLFAVFFQKIRYFALLFVGKKGQLTKARFLAMIGKGEKPISS